MCNGFTTGSGLSGKEGIAGFEGIGEIEIFDTRAICQTPSS